MRVWFPLALIATIGFLICGASAQTPPPYAVAPPTSSAPPPPLVPAAPLGWRSNRPSPEEIKRVTPEIEIWRPGATLPQRAAALAKSNASRRQLEQALIHGSQPVLIRLNFDPSARGKTVLVRAGAGVFLHPPEGTLKIRPTGECAVTVTLDAVVPESNITFYSEGIITKLPIARTSSRVIEAKENADAQRGQ